MGPDTMNYELLCIHKDEKIIPSHAIQRQTSVSAMYGSKKNLWQEPVFETAPKRGICIQRKLVLLQQRPVLESFFEPTKSLILCVFLNPKSGRH